jgi:hypothetical protein
MTEDRPHFPAFSVHLAAVNRFTALAATAPIGYN